MTETTENTGKTPKMTEKQKRFADAYLEHGNALRAAREAGYDCGKGGRAAYKALTAPAVEAYLSAQNRARRREIRITQAEIEQGLLMEARGEGQRSTAAARVSAWNTLARIRGLFEADNRQRANVVQQIAVLPADVLEQLERKLSTFEHPAIEHGAADIDTTP